MKSHSLLYEVKLLEKNFTWLIHYCYKSEDILDGNIKEEEVSSIAYDHKQVGDENVTLAREVMPENSILKRYQIDVLYQLAATHSYQIDALFYVEEWSNSFKEKKSRPRLKPRSLIERLLITSPRRLNNCRFQSSRD